MVRSRKNKTGEETLTLGQAAMYLRDELRLKWCMIAERIGVPSIPMVRFYYEKAKRIHAKQALIAAAAAVEKKRMILEDRDKAMARPAELSFEEVEALAKRTKINVGWIWLYHNGFRYHVPKEVQQKIEEEKIPAVDPEPGEGIERGLRK